METNCIANTISTYKNTIKTYLVPNSAIKKANKCLGCLCKILQISVKLTKDVFLVPTLTTWGGFMTNFRFPPSTMAGFLARIMSKTRFKS